MVAIADIISLSRLSFVAEGRVLSLRQVTPVRCDACISRAPVEQGRHALGRKNPQTPSSRLRSLNASSSCWAGHLRLSCAKYIVPLPARFLRVLVCWHVRRLRRWHAYARPNTVAGGTGRGRRRPPPPKISGRPGRDWRAKRLARPWAESEKWRAFDLGALFLSFRSLVRNSRPPEHPAPLPTGAGVCPAVRPESQQLESRTSMAPAD